MTNVIFPGINTDNSGDVYAGANSNLAYEEMNTLTPANLLTLVEGSSSYLQTVQTTP